MRTFASLVGRRVVTQSGTELGHCHDLRATLTETRLEVTALCVGRAGYLERLGIPGRAHDEVSWSSILRIEGHTIVVRDP